jgi:predicted ATPase/class 3 adenylate cyclase
VEEPRDPTAGTDAQRPAGQSRAEAAESLFTSGTLTFLFTDVEGSTRMWEEDPVEAGVAMARHERLLRSLVSTHRGKVVKGTGDGVLAVFESAHDALAAGVRIQLDLRSDSTLRVRIGIHTGEAQLRRGDYYGTALNRCQRVMDAGHGGQILLTLATEKVLTRPLPEGVTLLDLGHHRLRDLPEPMQLFQVVHDRLPSQFPALRGGDAFEHNLPVQLTTFVGREEELARSSDLLAASRIATLTGIGGCGKTRLALRVAAHHLTEFPSGVWLAEFTYVSDADLVPRIIAQAVGVPDEPGRDLLDSVAMRLRQAPALLVFDNCEHLLGPLASAIDRLLRAAPGLKVLATSRERLGVHGEAVYVVPPMSVPSREESESADRAMEHDAVRLFSNRASLARAGFEVDDSNARDVGRICRAVDGIPLAIELAAGRVGALSVGQVATLLEGRLEIVGSSTRTGDRRHQTMEATLDWSYQLLTPFEREVLAQLATFSGSFALEQVEAVCGVADGDDATLQAVLALLEKSLVAGDTTTGRYRLLEPVRRYAADKLAASGRHAELTRRHAEFFRDLVETAQDEAEGATQAEWLDRLETDHDNIRAALRWAIEGGETDLALRIAVAVWTFWKLRGSLVEGRDWLEQVIHLAEGATHPLLAQALYGAGDLDAGLGHVDEARQHLEASLALTEELGDEGAAAACLTRLAGLAYRQADLPAATRLFEDALKRAHRAADPRREGQILTSLALLSEEQGHTADADQYVAGALNACSRKDDLYVALDALLAGGEIAINREDWDRARRALTETLETARSAGFTDLIAWSTAYLGKLALGEGRAEDGEQRLSESLAMFQRLELPLGQSWAMRHLGRTALAQGDDVRASALLTGALRISLEQVRPDAPMVLQALAELGARLPDPEPAAVLLGAAQVARQRIGLTLPVGEQRIADETEATLRHRISDPRFSELVAQGAAMTLDDAADFAAAQI